MSLHDRCSVRFHNKLRAETRFVREESKPDRVLELDRYSFFVLNRLSNYNRFQFLFDFEVLAVLEPVYRGNVAPKV